MQKDFTSTQNIEMPQKAPCSHGRFKDNPDYEFEKLSKSYEIHNIPQVRDFITKNGGLLQYIRTITPLINNYFPAYKKCLTFCRDPEFSELDDITIYINSIKSSFESDWERLDELEKELFYVSEFPARIKGLVSLDLWF